MNKIEKIDYVSFYENESFKELVDKVNEIIDILNAESSEQGEELRNER